MRKLVINNARLLLPSQVMPQAYLVCEDGMITRYGSGSFQPDQEDTVIDAKNNWVSPGFIDIHIHGAGGHDFMDNTVEAYLEIAGTVAKYGTTALLPTTLASSNEELFRTFETYKQAKLLNRKGASFLGLHLEGPYFSFEQRGAQDPEYLRNPEPDEYNRILDASEDIVRWSLAPELEGALAFGRILKERNILPSVAHTNAIYEEVIEAFQAGFTHVTHLYSAMSSVVRKNAYRYAGAVEAAYLIDDMTVEIIADGVHLPKPLLQFVYKFKGPDKIALCTDAMRGAGMPDGTSVLGSLKNGRPVIIEDGVAKLPDRSAFAGSVATADRLVRTMIDVAEVSLPDAVKMMTLTPARIIGVADKKGAIDRGKDADIVIFDDRITIQATIVGGEVVYSR